MPPRRGQTRGSSKAPLWAVGGCLLNQTLPFGWINVPRLSCPESNSRTLGECSARLAPENSSRLFIYFSPPEKQPSSNSPGNTGSCCLVVSQMAATLGWQGLLFLMSCAYTKAKHLELPCGLSIWPRPHTSLNQMRPNNCELNSMNDSWRSGRRGPPPETSQPLWLEIWKRAMNMHEALKPATGGWFVKWSVFDHRGESSCGFPWLEEKTLNVQLPESLNY